MHDPDWNVCDSSNKYPLSAIAHCFGLWLYSIYISLSDMTDYHYSLLGSGATHSGLS